MAIATLDQWVAASKQLIPLSKTQTATSVAAQWHTVFDRTGNPSNGSLAIGNTANGVVPTDATTGCPAITDFAGGATGYISGIDWGCTVASRLFLYDRLFHAGSYAYNSGTTNLSSQPSYSGRLPGGSYLGLQIWVEVNQAWASSTASSVNVSYTNQADGTSSTGAYTLPTAVITGRMFQLPLAAGDTMVKAITSVVLATTTGSPSAGSVNIIVARPLWIARVNAANMGDSHGMDKTGLPVIYGTSALALAVAADSTSTGNPDLLIEIASA